MSTPTEPRNPLYFLLLIVGLLFVVTAVACFIVPMVEDKAREQGADVPPSAFRDSLRTDGWKWAVAELAVLAVLAVASMVWDRLRCLQKERGAGTMPQQKPPNSSPSP
jgi:hypothetical protein